MLHDVELVGREAQAAADVELAAPTEIELREHPPVARRQPPQQGLHETRALGQSGLLLRVGRGVRRIDREFRLGMELRAPVLPVRQMEGDAAQVAGERLRAVEAMGMQRLETDEQRLLAQVLRERCVVDMVPQQDEQAGPIALDQLGIGGPVAVRDARGQIRRAPACAGRCFCTVPLTDRHDGLGTTKPNKGISVCPRSYARMAIAVKPVERRKRPAPDRCRCWSFVVEVTERGPAGH